MAKGDAATPYFFFNGSSSSIHIFHADGMIAIDPMKSVSIPREIATPWLATPIGQAYVDKGILRTSETDEMSFAATSELTVPASLAVGAAAAGGVVATLEKRETAGTGTV